MGNFYNVLCISKYSWGSEHMICSVWKSNSSVSVSWFSNRTEHIPRRLFGNTKYVVKDCLDTSLHTKKLLVVLIFILHLLKCVCTCVCVRKASTGCLSTKFRHTSIGKKGYGKYLVKILQLRFNLQHHW